MEGGGFFVQVSYQDRVGGEIDALQFRVGEQSQLLFGIFSQKNHPRVERHVGDHLAELVLDVHLLHLLLQQRHVQSARQLQSPVQSLILVTFTATTTNHIMAFMLT